MTLRILMLQKFRFKQLIEKTVMVSYRHEIVFKRITHRVKFLKRVVFWRHPPSFFSSDFGDVTPPLSCTCHVTVRWCCRRRGGCKIPDMIICPTLASLIFSSRFLYFSTIAVVPSLSASFVPTCTSMDPPFPLPMISSTLSVTCSILAPGKQTTTSSHLLNLVSVFRTIESPT